MDIKAALLMDLPEGKLAGFYAQVVKALAGKAALFDRDKELLVLQSEQDQPAVLDVLNHYNIDAEPMELLLLPAGAERTRLFSDYGFTSRSDYSYLYIQLVQVFRFADVGSAAEEREQALRQMDEHLLARFTEQAAPVFAVDRKLEELMHGIAKAYGCRIELLLHAPAFE